MKVRVCLAVIVGLFFIDQLSKGLMISFLETTVGFYELIPGFLNFVRVWNKGISFGLLSQMESANLILSIFIGFIIAMLFLIVAKLKSLEDRLPLSMIIAGSLGNFCDRLRFGAVFDFIDFYCQGIHWPAFNFADTIIFLGVFMFF